MSDLVISYTDNCWYSGGYKLCPSCSRFVFLFCYERDFITSLSDDN